MAILSLIFEGGGGVLCEESGDRIPGGRGIEPPEYRGDSIAPFTLYVTDKKV